jgi:hypothetical protein
MLKLSCCELTGTHCVLSKFTMLQVDRNIVSCRCKHMQVTKQCK